MSVYGINKVCYLSQTDLNFRDQLKRNPEAALTGFPLTPEERKAFLDWNVDELYQAGAHSFLLSRLPRFESMGLTRQEYIKRMRRLLAEGERRQVEGRSRG